MEELEIPIHWFVLECLVFVALGFVIGAVAIMADIELSQETADDICKHLTSNNSAVAIEEWDDKLHCELPTYDETQNIIIKTNAENT